MKFNRHDFRLAITFSVIYALVFQVIRFLERLYSIKDWGKAWADLNFIPDFPIYLGVGFLIGLGIAYFGVNEKPIRS